MDRYEDWGRADLEEEYDRILLEIDTKESALAAVINELANLTAPEQLGDIPLASQAIRWDRIGTLIRGFGTRVEEIEELVQTFELVQWHLTESDE